MAILTVSFFTNLLLLLPHESAAAAAPHQSVAAVVCLAPSVAIWRSRVASGDKLG